MSRYAILCVDDDPMITQLLTFQLRKWINPLSTIIETFTDPRKVMDTIEEIHELGMKVVFLIVDYQMPGMNGAQLILKIREKYKDIQFVMLSGQANEVVVAQLQNEALLENFIAKPWSESQLHEMIKPYLLEMK